MAKQSTKATIDHRQIQRWAEARNGKPAAARGTSIIRIDFPGYSGGGRGRKLQPITWDEWFERFDDSRLALLYQEKTATGRTSSFNKLVGRETVDLKTAELRQLPRRRAKQRAGAARGTPAKRQTKRPTRRRTSRAGASAG